jgi:hypothetical protein
MAMAAHVLLVIRDATTDYEVADNLVDIDKATGRLEVEIVKSETNA